MADRKSNLWRYFPSTATRQTQTETDHIIRLAIEVGRLQAELERAQASEQATLRMYMQLEAAVKADEDLPVAISADTITAGRIEARAIVLTDSAGQQRALLRTQGGIDGTEETSFALFDKNGDLRLTMKAQEREAALRISSGTTVKEWADRITIGYDHHLPNGIRVSDDTGADVALLTEASCWHKLDEDEDEAA